MNRRAFVLSCVVFPVAPLWAHHGWSSFDETQPIYLEGVVRNVRWQNPHAEVTLEIQHAPVPKDLGSLPSPKQQSPVDAASVLGRAIAPTRKDRLWTIEFAPLFRMQAWNISEPKLGDRMAVVGYALKDDKGGATLRAEYWIIAGRAIPLRSMPA